MNKITYKLSMDFLNSRAFNYLLRKFTNSKFSKKFIPFYIRKFKINEEELLEKPEAYTSLNDFFTRKINPSLRPLAADPRVLISPCDGLLTELGQIDENSDFLIKSKPYSLEDLLEKDDFDLLKGGSYGLIYLSPANYHRFHALANCQLIDQYSRGNKSEPVNDMGLKYGDKPIVKNFRQIQKLRDEDGNIFYVIYIGAVNVNSIVVHDKKAYKKGEEVGYFQFGSSILLLFPRDTYSFICEKNEQLKYGQGLLKKNTYEI
ncbi:MAG: archaetidylserine decarboxylase [Tissierellia bacterium]|nr:archaetidylserine decarboxylase [Tissierellia bacterium]